MQLNMASHYEFRDNLLVEKCSLFQPKLFNALCPAFQLLHDSNKLQKQIQELYIEMPLLSVMNDMIEKNMIG